MMKNTGILIVDDEASIRRMFSRALETRGYPCRTADSVDAALAAVAEEEPAVVVTDIRMPGRDGRELLKELVQRKPDVMVILMTAYAEIDVAIECLQGGASDFLTKPVRVAHLLTSVERALDRRHIIIENRNYQHDLESKIEGATADLRSARDSLAVSYRQTLEALSSALDAREAETGDHSRRVIRFSMALADRLDFPDSEREDLAMGGLLHDIGKIGVPDQILLKPGPLDEDEWTLMRRHPDIGFKILNGIPFLSGAKKVVLYHHENFDGSGYPEGLSGTKLPQSARIFSVADTLDAITHDRPYRKAQHVQAAFEEIQRCSGTQFDPEIARALFEIGEIGILSLEDAE